MITSWPARAARTPPLTPCARARMRSAGPRRHAPPVLLFPRAAGRSALALTLPFLHPAAPLSCRASESRRSRSALSTGSSRVRLARRAVADGPPAARRGAGRATALLEHPARPRAPRPAPRRVVLARGQAAAGGGPARPPGHDDRAGRQPALQDLIPADQVPAARAQEGIDAAHEPGLQRELVRQALLGQARLAARAALPAVLGALRARRAPAQGAPRMCPRRPGAGAQF